MLNLHTLHAEVSDMDVSVAFYESLFGVSFTSKSPHWSQFAVGDLTIGLHPRYSPHPGTGGWVLGIAVESVTEWITKLEAAGIDRSEIDRLPDGTPMVSFADPDGNRWQVIQPG
jgi:predicted enzyme related to lactoylglutathione lyase